MSYPPLVALALAAVALAAAGCGKSTDSPALTRSQLIAKADPICAGVNHELTIVNAVTKRQSLRRVAVEVGIYDQRAFAQLKKLKPPAAMTSDWNVILTSIHTLGKDIPELGEIASAKNPKLNAKILGEFNTAQSDRATAAAHSGFDNCAKF
jgi:hypothetical protein